MLYLLLLAAVLLPLLVFLYVFATTYEDFTLLSKGPTPRSAIEDKVVWITGASQNIGEELAKEYARLGARIILTSRREAELERVKASLKGKYAPDDVVVLPADISCDMKELKEIVDKAEVAFGGAGIDIMVQNAAAGRPKLAFVDFPDDMLQSTFDINVLGTIRLTQLVLRGMLQRGKGQFIAVSSAAGVCPSPGQTVYTASKHAQNGFFHALRTEVLHRGVRVTVVCPGPIDTTRQRSEAEEKMEKRLSVPKCAELIVKAGAYDLSEAWICYQPVLALLYVVQYAPALGFFFLNKGFASMPPTQTVVQIGPKRLQSYRDGSGGAYDMRTLLKKSS